MTYSLDHVRFLLDTVVVLGITTTLNLFGNWHAIPASGTVDMVSASFNPGGLRHSKLMATTSVEFDLARGLKNDSPSHEETCSCFS